MFDDQINVGPKPPANLPISEPVDMFNDTDTAVPVNNTTPEPASALDKGILRPVSVPPQIPNEVYTVKEPALFRGILTVLVIVLIGGGLGFGGWWLYNKFIKNSSAVTPAPITTETPVTEENVPEVIVPVAETVITTEVGNEDVVQNVVDDKILFGEPIDKDSDGLDDAKEVELGTDPNNWDSDFDELGDGDEVLIWKTNPMNSDTDGDTYKDGAEVKSGYNPNGPGKIFEPPKEVKTL